MNNSNFRNRLPHIAHLIPHTSYPTPHTSHLIIFLLFSLSPFLLFSQPSVKTDGKLHTSHLTPHTSIIILHTNDTHSRFESYYEQKEGDVGGIVRRNTFIGETRSQYPNTIVVDAGDFSQGTPYFNLFKGIPEIEMMNAMGYDVVTLGNHEFDNGSKALAKRLKQADFKIVCANYQFKNKTLAKLVKPYTIITIGDKKIGFFGLLCDMKRVTMPNYYQEVTFSDPIVAAKKTVDILKNKEQCDIIICLSHLGFTAEFEGDLTDRDLAENVSGIDFIIGGHTHLLLEEPVIVNNTKIIHAGKNGIYVGKIVVNL
jgi:5'-nucleotidase